MDLFDNLVICHCLLILIWKHYGLQNLSSIIYELCRKRTTYPLHLCFHHYTLGYLMQRFSIFVYYTRNIGILINKLDTILILFKTVRFLIEFMLSLLSVFV